MAIKLKRTSKQSGDDQLPVVPTVNMLPPSVHKSLDLQKSGKVALGLGIAFVVVNGLLIGVGTFIQNGASSELTSAKSTTQQMQITLKQNSDALTISSDIDQLQQDRIAVTAREGDWNDLLQQVTAATPSGMTITVFNLQTVGSSSSGSSSSATTPSADNIGTVKVTAESNDLPNISQWIDNVRTINGVSDVSAQQIDSQTDSSSTSAATTYQSQLTITVSAARFTNRFVSTEQGGE